MRYRLIVVYAVLLLSMFFIPDAQAMRWYSEDIQRWISRDPIEEEGGLNLYGFCRNDGVNNLDILGMAVEYRSTVVAGYNTLFAEESGHEVFSITGKVKDENDSTTYSKKGVDDSNFGAFYHTANKLKGKGTVCNTPSDIQIEAKTDCPGKYNIVCYFSYYSTVKSDIEAFASVSFYVAGALKQKEKDGGTGGAPAEKAILQLVNVRHSGTMQLSSTYQTIGQLFPVQLFKPNGHFVEKASVKCIAWLSGGEAEE